MSSPVTRFFASRGFARGVGAVGRFMITSGTVILLLVAYQLWGTNLQTARAQNEIETEFAAQLSETGGTTAPRVSATTGGDTPASVGSGTSTTTTTEPPATTPPSTAPTVAPPAEGEAAGRISIPSIGLRNFYFVEGTGVRQLKRGAAHYPSTPLPGQAGNAAIAGHRTTYGAPFHNIDKVKPGDEVIVETIQGRFTYRVTETVIVKPRDVWVLDQRGKNELTLTACHPKFSARERIVTFAELVGEPVAEIPGQREAAEQTELADESEVAAIDEFADEPPLRFPGAWWGLACVGLWICVRLLAYAGHRTRKYPRWIPYVVLTPVCLLFLYFFFEAFSYEGFARAVNLSL